MLRIVMDSAGDLLPGWAEEFGIDIIPINIQFGERTFLSGVDLSNTEFYRMADESGIIPQSSQPSPQQFMDLYERIAEPGDTILSIHVTAKLSGTFDSAIIAARELSDKIHVIPIDSAGGSAEMGYMCREARLMERSGATTDEIVARMKFIARNVCIILTLDTLEYARRSGRVGTLSAAMASMLNVKPIALLQDGIVNMVEKVRTRKASLERVISLGQELVGDKPIHLGVVHARDIESCKSLLEEAKKHLNIKSAEMTDLSISLAINFGPGTVGLVLYPA
jgi:DegV family protein with EDD domain